MLEGQNSLATGQPGIIMPVQTVQVILGCVGVGRDKDEPQTYIHDVDFAEQTHNITVSNRNIKHCRRRPWLIYIHNYNVDCLSPQPKPVVRPSFESSPREDSN